MQTARRWPLIGFAALMVALLTIYGRDIGHGFVKDDVVWVGENHVGSMADLRALAVRTNGFYRPVVSLSFAVDRALYDLRPFGYGVTNLLLLMASAAALAWLARGMGFTAGAAVLAASIWALNFHGINMAVLWLSGRTALLVCLCALVAAGAIVRGWALIAAIAALLAMLSKEEAVLLPLILSAWVWLRCDTKGAMRVAGVSAAKDGEERDEAWVRAVASTPSSRLAAVARHTWGVWLALVVYLLVRSQTAAYTPGSSPWFYRFTFAPMQVLANAAEYVDRAGTFAALSVIVASLVAWRRPRLTDGVRRLAPLALIWIAGSYALTVFLPVRSSLYACLPSIGAALLAAAVIDTMWVAEVRRRLVVAAVGLPLALLPVYWSRNVRWVEIADLSASTFAVVRDTAAAHDGNGEPHLVFEDDRSTRASLVNTFGTLLPEAVALAAGRRLPVWLEPPPDDWQGSALTSPLAAPRIVRFRVDGGRRIVTPRKE